VTLSGPGRSGGDEPGFEAIGGCVHKQRALNILQSSGTSARTFAVSAGPYRNYRVTAGTKNKPYTFFVPLQKKGWKIDLHVSNLRSREFLFQGVHAGRRINFAPVKSLDSSDSDSEISLFEFRFTVFFPLGCGVDS